jgi:hypothetical protein
MAHFAGVNDEGIVERVVVVSNEFEINGQEYLNNLGVGGRWIQTSYNTYGGVHANGGDSLRYNYAGIGYSYDEIRDAFIAPQPFPSWILDEETCLWNPPVPPPSPLHVWDESTQQWILPAD